MIVTAASVSDNLIGMDPLDRATAVHPTLTKTWVDAGFKNRVVEHGARLGVAVEIVTKDPQAKGFSVVKRRWVVERTLGWLMHRRRLARDYKARDDVMRSKKRLAIGLVGVTAVPPSPANHRRDVGLLADSPL